MKQKELQKCAGCGKGVMHNGSPILFRVRVDRMAVNVPAVQRQHGLELQLGGHALLANVIGPNEDLAVPLGEPVSVLICLDCSLTVTVAQLSEMPEVKS